MEPEMTIVRRQSNVMLHIGFIVALVVGCGVSAYVADKKGWERGYNEGFQTAAYQGFKVGLESGRACITDGVKGACEDRLMIEGSPETKFYWKTATKIYEFERGDIQGEIRDLREDE